MGLHNFIKISNFTDADFVEVMIETGINDANSENNLDDTEALNATNATDE